MRRNRARAALGFCAALVIATACGGDDGDSADESAAPAATASVTAEVTDDTAAPATAADGTAASDTSGSVADAGAVSTAAAPDTGVVSTAGASDSSSPSVTGSTGGDTAVGGEGMIEELRLPSEVGTTAGGLVNYNPYAPNPVTTTWLFEPLMIRNGLTCEITPWLVTDFAWEGATELTFTVRDGVTWSDGEAFTAEDVAFTMNLAKEYPAIDNGGLWNDTFGAPAESVVADGNQVVITFTGNAAPKFDAIIKIRVLPEHVYSEVGDPTQYIDEEPVSTGPFVVDSYNGRRLELVRNENYWQAENIHVERLVLEGTFEAAQAALSLQAGDLDAYWGDIPNPEQSFVADDPENNHFFYAPNGATVLSYNLEVAPFDDVAFREAMSFAIDREELSAKATYGVMDPASQSGLKPTVAELFLPSEYTFEDTITPFDPERAMELLDAAGYEADEDGRRTMPDGSPIEITFTVQAGWVDYQAMADVIVRNFNDVGINTSVVASAPDSVDAQKKSGEYDVMLEYLHGGCEMARGLGAKLATNQIPTQTELFANVQRYSDPATDEAVANLAASVDAGEQQQFVAELVETMLTEYPVTSLIYAPARLIYRTEHAVGWPTEEDPYAHPVDDKLLILTHLRPPQ